MAGKPVKKETLASMLNTGFFEVDTAIQSLKTKYGGPIIVRETADTAFMIVQDKFVNTLWFLGKGELTSGELKTLAMVAYHAPVKQSEIVRTRGNRAYEHLRKLEDSGLLVSERHANTRLLKLSKKFFEYFGDKIVERIRNSQAPEIGEA
ncbi:MAG: SMC-Scp complex subunit ScpB [Candidatus Altiarchaeota archaeon]|nr:SMC-Scp complex subunit ScpB [Candidatus Altiarchaeota archaeon]